MTAVWKTLVLAKLSFIVFSNSFPYSFADFVSDSGMAANYSN